jgi:starvation-inducible DNA-binding protein
MIRDLVDGHETIIKQIRGTIDLTAKLNDMGTNNFLCDLIEKHEKTAWMLRSHVEKSN